MMVRRPKGTLRLLEEWISATVRLPDPGRGGDRRLQGSAEAKAADQRTHLKTTNLTRPTSSSNAN